MRVGWRDGYVLVQQKVMTVSIPAHRKVIEFARNRRKVVAQRPQATVSSIGNAGLT